MRRSPLSPVRSISLLLAVLLLALAASGCVTSTDKSYSWTVRDVTAAPRVSVIHRPLHPEPGEDFSIIARPEVAPGAGVDRVKITVLSPRGIDDRICRPPDLNAEGHCVLELAGGSPEPGTVVYNAQVVDRRGVESRGVSGFTFELGPSGSPQLIRLRDPVNVDDAQTFDVLLVADLGSYGPGRFDDFLSDLEDALYDDLLEDPAYRWRDTQLAFWASTRPGIITDKDSGNASRCGGNPWPGIDLRAEVGFAEVIGVLHRNGGFRDCSGVDPGVGAAGVAGAGHFGAFAGRPGVFRHELGHALFGLGDEYTEPEADRTFAGGPGRACCCTDGGSMTGGGGPGSCLIPGSPACGQLWEPGCFGASATCPPLASSCGGLDPGGEAPFGNVFSSRADCRAAATAAAGHPGLEAAQRMAVDPDDCRLLCRGDCSCMGPEDEVWILDRRTSVGAIDRDVMGARETLTEPHGPACVRCLETRLCLRWEEGRGRTSAQARAHCLAPAG